MSTTRTSTTPASSPRSFRAAAAPQGVETLVLSLFFLSGASALIYEVVWGRLLANIFGGTAFAIATVLAAYMAGLALGSWLFGRWIDRRGNPLLTYAALEAGIAGWALLLPVILGLLNLVYGQIYRSMNPGPYILSLIRFFLSFLVLLVPTFFMGGTLPVLSRLLVAGQKKIGLKSGLLYGMNTAGAVAGTFTAGFFFIPAFGMRLSTGIAVAFNLAVALFAFLIARWIGSAGRPARAKASRGAAPKKESAPAGRNAADSGSVGTGEGAPAAFRPRVKRAALWVYALSGFAALTYELAWTKVLSGALGTTTYAFSAMLTTFLLGLAVGAFVFARLADRHDPALLLAWSQLAIAVLGLAALPLFGNLPILFIKAFKAWGPSWTAQTLSRFGLCALTMFPPTVLMGGAFPLVMRIYADEKERLGRQVGELYAANTVGAILGSFTAGFVLVPLVGRQVTIEAAVLVNVVSAGLLYLAMERTPSKRAWVVAGATAALLVPAAVVALRPWDRSVMASGAYVYAESMAKEPDLNKAIHDQRLLFYDEETEGNIAVFRAEHVVSLRTNGKVEASSSGDMLTQKVLSWVPILYHDGPAEVMMLGLASGISLGSVLVFNEVTRVDCVEMLPGMRAASAFFRKYNRNCLADPRTRLIINDGRNHLLLTDRSYDVIISQPSNPWIVGIGSLFTREFFELGRRRLKPGGTFCQWVQTYQMSRRDLGSVIRTFHEVFPHVAIWMGTPGDLILVGGGQPLRLDWSRIETEMSKPAFRDDLASIGLGDPYAFLSGCLGGEETMNRLMASAGPVVTDDNLLLEFSMPRNLYDSKVPMVGLDMVATAREPVPRLVSTAGLPPDSAAAVTRRIERYYQGREQGITGVMLNISGDHADAVKTLESALLLAPGDPLIRQYLGNSRNEVGIKLLQGDQPQQAIQEFRRAAEVGSRSERSLALNNIGLWHYGEGRIDSANACWKIAATLEPESPVVRFNLALSYESLGQADSAASEYRAVLAVDPDNSVALNNLAWILAGRSEQAAEAASLAARAVKLDPSAGNYDTWGWALLMAGRKTEAVSALRKAATREGADAETYYHFGEALAAAGRTAEARANLERAIREDKNGSVTDAARRRLQGL